MRSSHMIKDGPDGFSDLDEALYQAGIRQLRKDQTPEQRARAVLSDSLGAALRAGIGWPGRVVGFDPNSQSYVLQDGSRVPEPRD